MNETNQRKVIVVDGVRITTTETSFEISMSETNEVWEQTAAQYLKQWCRWRKTQTDNEEWKRTK